MQRIEIFSTEAVQEDFFEMLERETGITNYSYVTGTCGSGNQGKRIGDSVWPERNFTFICYVKDEMIERILEVAKRMKDLFPNDGIEMFSSEATGYTL